MIYFFTLLCCLSCFIHVASFIFIPWPIIIFDDAGNDASGNVYTPFLENQPRAPENNRMRRPQPPVTNMRPLLPRNPQNRLYPSRQQVATPQNTIKYITPYVSSPYCPAGQQYVYMPPTLDGDAVASICPLNNPIHPLCRCQTGCRHKNFFIPYGTSVMVDKCGNKCYCNSLNGEVECEFDSC
ncbi:uncharacterized protein LOC125668232 isoform X2 [Ostrea edulis]|uniref:uncharacterized protein LOC125668232 isoform X2 n=1 Tax=Ostrea edulis TaxID=37623 RepID=UPI0024AFAD3B|nr:uncharacterized protein LOC125668232 isoform X2 [Ostrea edulis]